MDRASFFKLYPGRALKIKPDFLAKSAKKLSLFLLTLRSVIREVWFMFRLLRPFFQVSFKLEFNLS